MTPPWPNQGGTLRAALITFSRNGEKHCLAVTIGKGFSHTRRTHVDLDSSIVATRMARLKPEIATPVVEHAIPRG